LAQNQQSTFLLEGQVMMIGGVDVGVGLGVRVGRVVGRVVG
jgi:hypothetical protein